MKLGNIGDIDINLYTGKIESITISTGKIMSFFHKDEEILIPWQRIKMIGEDVILVEYKDSQS